MAVLILLLVGFIETFRPGLGEFWPGDIDVSLCDVIYGFGNVLNHTYELPGIPGSTWELSTLERRPSRTASKRGTGMFGLQDVQLKVDFLTASMMASGEPLL